MTSLGLYIDGQWQQGQGSLMSSLDPATAESFWETRSANKDDVNSAVMAARHAFTEWSGTSLERRVAILRKFAALLDENRESMAALIGRETTKPLWEARTELTAMIGKIDLSIHAHELRTGVIHKDTAAGLSVTRHRPHGVVAVFGPYNFPGHLPNGHIVPALLAGNCVVFKPSELTPAVAEATVSLWMHAGLPAGVINLVQGGRDTGVALAAHPQVDGIFFTGSSSTGHHLHQQFGGRPDKILALEMGGNNPLIIDEVDTIDSAVYNAMFSAFVSAGQRCTCARRLMVPQTLQGDEFLEKLLINSAKIKIGRFDDEDQPFMGGLISEFASGAMLMAQNQLSEAGAAVLLRMESHASGLTSLTPGIVDVTGVKGIVDEEHFGPLLTVSRYHTLDEAIALANNTKYGLAAGIFTKHQANFDHFLRRSRAGIINWNKPLTGASSAAPFGGIGASGNHRASAFYAADYCAYPVASLESETIDVPAQLPPGIYL